MTQSIRTLHNQDSVPVVQLLRETAGSVQRVVEGEVQLALARAQDEIVERIRQGVMRAIAGVFLVFTLLLVELAAVLYAATHVQSWLAALIVAALNVATAALCWVLVSPKPEGSLTHVSTNETPRTQT